MICQCTATTNKHLLISYINSMIWTGYPLRLNISSMRVLIVASLITFANSARIISIFFPTTYYSLSFSCIISTYFTDQAPISSLVEERSSEGVPRIDITFPDGYKDTLVLHEQIQC